jgi:hypothetical protein
MISPTGPVSVLRLPFSFILRAVKSFDTCTYSSLEAMNTLVYLLESIIFIIMLNALHPHVSEESTRAVDIQ